MLTKMENDSGRIISEMNMEMIFEKCFLITNVVQKKQRKRYASEEIITNRSYAPRYALKQCLFSVEKKTSHSDMRSFFTKRENMVSLIESKIREKNRDEFSFFFWITTLICPNFLSLVQRLFSEICRVAIDFFERNRRIFFLTRKSIPSRSSYRFPRIKKDANIRREFSGFFL